VWGSNPGGGRFALSVQTDPEAHSASCTMGIGSLFLGYTGDGVMVTIHLLLAPGLSMSIAKPLFLLYFLIASYRVSFIFIGNICDIIVNVYLLFTSQIRNCTALMRNTYPTCFVMLVSFRSEPV